MYLVSWEASSNVFKLPDTCRVMINSHAIFEVVYICNSHAARPVDQPLDIKVYKECARLFEGAD